VSLVAPAVIAVRAGYERVVLAPFCRPHAAVTGLAYHGARLRFGSGDWLDWNTPARIDCLFAGPGQPGPVEVPLERVIGRGGAFGLIMAGVLVVPIGGLFLWAAASAFPAAWVVRAWRARRRVPG
jgi:hypothetical protein